MKTHKVRKPVSPYNGASLQGTSWEQVLCPLQWSLSTRVKLWTGGGYNYQSLQLTSRGTKGAKKQSIIFTSEKVRFPSVEDTISFRFLRTNLMQGSVKV